MFNFMMRSPLRDPDPNPAGGGAPPNPAGGAPNPGAGLDPATLAAITQTLMGEVNKTLNGFDRKMEARFQKFAPPVPPAPPANPPSDGHEGADPVQDPKLREALNRAASLERSQTEILKRLTAAEDDRKAQENEKLTAQKSALVAGAIKSFSFASEALADDMHTLIAQQIKRTEDGEWVGPDGVMTGKDFAQQFVKGRPHVLKMVDTNPAGARPGSLGGSRPVADSELDPATYHALSPARKAEVDAEMKARAVAWLGGQVSR